MSRALPGNNAHAKPQRLPSGPVASQLVLQRPVEIAGKELSRQVSLLPPIEHNYMQDEDRMSCEHCGFYYHL